LRVARVQIEDVATPVLTLVVDGAHYDVGRLHEQWRIEGDYGNGSFHSRVVGAGCAGLDELDGRLRAGGRPTEARIQPGEYLPLPPCDTERCALLLMRDEDGDGALSYERADSRAMVGDGQPVDAFADGLEVEAGLAVLLGDDLSRVGPDEAERAMLGVTAMLRWPGGGTHCGPDLLLRRRPRDIGALTASLGDWSGPIQSGWRRAPAEQVAYLSQHARLRAGDMVGLTPCCRRKVGVGAHQRFDIPKLLRLAGWATAALTAPTDWRS